MNKEVELILKKLKIVSEEKERGLYLCDKEHSKLLLDYITNLQRENERLKLEKDTKSVSEIICENLHDVYKSRCEKVQEIINTEKKLMGYAIYDSCLLLIEEALNGRSDE